MKPFAGFQRWIGRAGPAEVASAGIALCAALAVLGWTVAPVGTASVVAGHATGAPASGVPGVQAVGALGSTASTLATTGSTVSAGTPSASSTGTAGGSDQAKVATASSAPAGSSGPGASAGSQKTPTGNGCVSPAGSDQGVSPSSIKIAVTVTNIAGPTANGAFGIESAQQAQQDYQNVISSINASGGVACRKLVPLFEQINPADSSDLQQKCLTIVQAGVFAEIDQGGYGPFPSLSCFPQNHIPYFGAFLLPEGERAQYYPYLFAFDTGDNVYHNTVFGLARQGFFEAANGFQKLGLAYEDCYAGLFAAEMSWLHQVGLNDSQIVPYDVGCPSALASPGDLEQAILRFQQNGVTNVTEFSFVGNMPAFTTIAQQQGFHPRYGLPDDSLIRDSYGSDPPNSANLAGALAITDSAQAAERTPGMAPDAVTGRCSSILQSSTGPDVAYPNDGDACDVLWMFAAAVEHAAQINRTYLAAGLEAAKTVEFSYPEAPPNFAAAGRTTGDPDWRVAQFMTSCSCWQLVDRTFHPGFN